VLNVDPAFRTRPWEQNKEGGDAKEEGQGEESGVTGAMATKVKSFFSNSVSLFVCLFQQVFMIL